MYKFLNEQPVPKMMQQALRLLGTKEKAGKANNPVIMSWAKELKIPYHADSVPWCGLFMAIVAKRADKDVPDKPLWARNWANWGDEVKSPVLGDVLVFVRQGGGGHVGLYVGEDLANYHVLGGNQSDMVSIVKIAKNRLIAARNQYKIGQPAYCKKIYFGKTETKVSENEA